MGENEERLADSVKPLAFALNQIDGQPMKREIT